MNTAAILLGSLFLAASQTNAVRFTVPGTYRLDVATVNGYVGTLQVEAIAGPRPPRLTVQLEAGAFVRGIFHYTTIERNPELYLTPVEAEDSDLFSQLLFTYKLNPQTALYLGYSGEYVDMSSRGLRQTGDTAFLKLSYAWLP